MIKKDDEEDVKGREGEERIVRGNKCTRRGNSNLA
jgi:hypothetical protein